MHFFIVFIATAIALFWDETLIALIGALTQKKFSAKFMMYWFLFSGILTTLLITMHVPQEYRIITMIMISVAIIFNLRDNTKHKQLIPVN